MLRRFLNKLLHSATHSHRRHYGSSARHYGKRYSSSHGYTRPMMGRSSSDYKHRHGYMGSGYYKSRRHSSS
ncbi:hypothetical protein NSQ80_10455 [Paenibacillus sp. FSL K6-2441]|uniref:hypothetical protein n=1 Tax=unclassified Paenibacillus TaxID=185978 RepID=UPI0021A41785|nr:hypothetical protein [Paenibacillus sp. p3-SID1389]MCT2194504.1 hypothetical protein [Paenibacillus sp. p3-SID1389]